MGGLSLENTHPFCLGNYTLGHNGTIVRYPRLLEPGMRRPEGDTDSEHLFSRLMHDFDPGAPVESLRATLRTTVQCSPFSGLNILFSDGEKLFAYRLGMFELHWLARPGQLLVASERVTDEPAGTASSRTCCSRSTRRTSRSRTPSGCWATRSSAPPRSRRWIWRRTCEGTERGQAAAERARAAAAAG